MDHMVLNWLVNRDPFLLIQVVVSNICNFHPYLGRRANLTSIFFKRGWFNHQLVINAYCNPNITGYIWVLGPQGTGTYVNFLGAASCLPCGLAWIGWDRGFCDGPYVDMMYGTSANNLTNDIGKSPCLI